MTHRYRRSGTHTARVTVTDSEGARATAEREITVTRSGGSKRAPRDQLSMNW